VTDRPARPQLLTISDEAARLVRTLTHGADLPDDAGMRIVVDPRHNSLSMALATEPEPSDIVVGKQGARVFLTASASRRLQRRTLRAELTDSRKLFFLDGESRR
jgi:Fe-S cluster assembly iron-binding protein IscA